MPTRRRLGNFLAGDARAAPSRITSYDARSTPSLPTHLAPQCPCSPEASLGSSSERVERTIIVIEGARHCGADNYLCYRLFSNQRVQHTICVSSSASLLFRFRYTRRKAYAVTHLCLQTLIPLRWVHQEIPRMIRIPKPRVRFCTKYIVAFSFSGSAPYHDPCHGQSMILHPPQIWE